MFWFWTIHYMSTPTPAERVASRTWSTLGLAKQLRARFGEESLTDLLMLEMLPHQRARGFWLFSTTKPAESVCGADLLLILRHRTRSCSWLALQAKKLYPNDRYGALGGQQSVAQLGRLERFARQLRALPLYLLYNHTNSASPAVHWHCPKRFAADQLGCTLVPSWHIRGMIQPRISRNFDLAHSVGQSIPWRCAFDCPAAGATLTGLAVRSQTQRPYEHLELHKTNLPAYDWTFDAFESPWPEWLFSKSTSELTKEDIDRIQRQLVEYADATGLDFPQDHARSDEPLYPARLLIVDQVE